MSFWRCRTVFEVHNADIMNLCVPEGSFWMSYGYDTLESLREAYPDRPRYVRLFLGDQDITPHPDRSCYG